jgi:hypothetical protein
MICPIDADALRRHLQTTAPFPHFIVDDFLDPDFANTVQQSFPAFEDALKIGRSFKTVNEKRKVQITDVARFAPPIVELNRLLSSPSWLDLLSQVFGIPQVLADEELVGGGMHQTGARGRLDVHVDFNFIAERGLYRRLNALIFFNSDWRPEWGGFLELWDPEVKRCHQSLEPKFNRCVVFETSDISFHGVTAVNCPPDRTRKSFAAYYYTKEPPPNWNGKAHDSIFRSRPDERIRGHVLMPAERVWRWTKRSLEDLSRGVRKIF